MKTKIIISLLMLFIITSCANEIESETKNQQGVKSPIEGTWKLIGYEAMLGDSLAIEWHSSDTTFRQIKMWTKDYFSFVNESKTDTVIVAAGGGTYMLNGNQYIENPIYHSAPSYRDTSLNMTIEIRNDTLTQSWNEKYQGKIYAIQEKYLKLD